MLWVFLACALFGGTLLVCQFAMTLVGLGMSEFESDGLAGSDGIDHADMSGDSGLAHDQGGEQHHQDGTALFGMLTFRTLTAAVTFFGLAGYAANSVAASLPSQLGVAILSGAAALYVVHWLMRTMLRLGEDGTERIDRAVGREGTVYLTIPAARHGMGKIQFKLQNRLVEYAAITDCHEPLPTGSKIRILSVIGPNTLAVEPSEPARTAA